ncbi:MAG: ABC transporter substrate-binding protein, partial [Actinomycetota bacterium]
MAHRRGLAPVIGLVLLLVAGACSGSDDGAEDASSSTSGSEPVVAEAASDGGRADNIEPSGRDEDGGDAETDAEGEAAAAAPPPDTLVWVVATEPPDLHLDDPANGLTVTSWIRQGLFESLFGVGPDLTYHPELLASEPTIIPQDDASVIIEYELRDGLSWSDGTPLTSEDVAYTHRIITEGCTVEGDGSILDNSNEGCVYQTTSRLGYDQVTNFEVVDETDFTVTMAGFYPDWRRLYGPVFAAHAFGEDAGIVNRSLRNLSGPSGTLPSSGPLVFERWDKGVSMTLAANPDYHGSTAPQVQADGPATIGAVRVDFVPDPQERVDALIEGRADLLLERIRPGQSPLFDADGVATATVPSLDYDHWGLNLLNPHLAQSQVRRAVAVAIDKQVLVDTVFDPNVEVGVQDNTYWLADQPAYAPTQSPLTTGDPEAAKALLAEAGYQPGDDGVFRHPTLGPLRLRVTTIGGDPLREAAQEVLIDQLAEAGIEVVADNPAGGRFFQ